MGQKAFYQLPDLPYGYSDLEPHISQQLLTIHHDRHHQGYVNGANGILEVLDDARQKRTQLDMKSILKALSFNVGGLLLHSLFWANMAPEGKGGGRSPNGSLAQALEAEFGSFDRFREEFSQTANSVEGSGWAALAYCRQTQRPLIMQIEKHNVNVYPMFRILMVLDLWEHAYYLDYKNARADFVRAFWNIVNWGEVDRRLAAARE